MSGDIQFETEPVQPARWTTRAYLLVVFGGGLAALAVALRSPVPLFAGLPLLLAPLLSAASVPQRLSQVDLEWQASGMGQDVTITGVLRADFGGHVGDVSITLPRPPGTVEAEPMRFEREPKEIRFTVRWTFAEPSIITVLSPRVYWRDPLGLTERTLEGARPPLPLERYPPGLSRVGSIRLERTIMQPGEIRSRVAGASGDFYGLREAAPDEPPRRINWRATARTGRLLANDYQLERTGDLVLLLDVRPTTAGPEVDERLLGVARAAVYGIAESLLRSKVRVGFAAFGEFVEAVPLSTGRVHRVRVLQGIVAAKRSDVAGPSERCALGLRRFFRPGVTILVVSSWAGDPAFDLLPYIRRQGFPVVLLSPSPLPMFRGTGGLAEADEPLAERLEQLQRRTRLSDLWQHGPVVDWTDYWTLDALIRVLRQPAHRRIS
ncbi:MAG TPA: DUF58 domain-containing protein [Thermoplasmata archaeon]|nr:DUF58 domain-containing protein [Thermoplasmata archaeon]